MNNDLPLDAQREAETALLAIAQRIAIDEKRVPIATQIVDIATVRALLRERWR